VFEKNLLHLVALVMALFLVLPGFLYYMRKPGKQTPFRNIALWTILGLITALLYSLYMKNSQ